MRWTRNGVAALLAAAMVGACDLAAAAQGGAACVDRIARDLREGEIDRVAGLLVEPPSYDLEKAAEDREGSAAGLRAVLATLGGIEDVTPMKGPRRYYRVQISGGTPEAWAGIGRPMATEIVERDVRFGRAGRGVLIVKLAKGDDACGVASLDLGLEAEQAGSREKMIETYVAVMEAVGIGGEPAEMRHRAESMLTTYDAGGAGSAAPSAGGGGASTPAHDGSAAGPR